ncbi:MAG: low molecular weight phosphatase family protein [Dehalococcoidia bacterium]
MTHTEEKQILFVCIGNVHRSPMAEAFFNDCAPPGYRAVSAGLRPGRGLNPDAVAVMAEVGLDISLYFPKPLTPDIMSRARRIVSVGVDADYLMDFDERWEVEDPLHQPVEKLREIRDVIREKVLDLAARLEVR